VTVTVPLTVPGGQEEEDVLLELPLDPEPPPQDMEVVVAKRLANWVRPRPEAIWGRTVISNTKLASAMTAARIRCCLVFMTTPPSLSSVQLALTLHRVVFSFRFHAPGPRQVDNGRIRRFRVDRAPDAGRPAGPWW
jgi:hypothetical protein